MLLRLLAFLPLLLTPQLLAQQSPKFEVASIRPHEGPLHVIAGFNASGPRLTMEAYNFRLLVMEAYNLKNYQVSFISSNVGEDADANTYYNIAATADGNPSPTRDQFRQMLQTLLADRFHLRLHHETKEMPVYALVVAKSGPKFKQSTLDATASTLVTVHGRNQGPTVSKGTMPELADIIISGFGLRLPVIDKTGLTGAFDYKFEATPEYRILNNPQPDDVSIFDTLEDKLGLQLVVQKAPIEILVVEHIEKPTKN